MAKEVFFDFIENASPKKRPYWWRFCLGFLILLRDIVLIPWKIGVWFYRLDGETREVLFAIYGVSTFALAGWGAHTDNAILFIPFGLIIFGFGVAVVYAGLWVLWHILREIKKLIEKRMPPE